MNQIQISEDCKDFISKCLAKQADERLGTKDDVKEILSHSWFQSIDIEAIKNKTMQPKFKPEISDDPFDVSNFEEDLTSEPVRHSILESKDLKYI